MVRSSVLEQSGKGRGKIRRFACTKALITRSFLCISRVEVKNNFLFFFFQKGNKRNLYQSRLKIESIMDSNSNLYRNTNFLI